MPRLAWKHGLLAKLETLYATDSSPVGGNDAIRIRNNIKVTNIELEGEELDVAMAHLGNQQEIPTVEFKQIEFTVFNFGSGVAGTAPPFGKLLRACGMTETVVADTSVAYALNSTAADSMTLKYNKDGKLHALLGARGDADFQWMAKKLSIINFRFCGLYVPITDAVMPSLTLTAWRNSLPVNNANSGPLEVHGYEAAMHELSIKLGNAWAKRNLVGANDVLISDRKPSGTLRIADPTVTQWDYMEAVRTAELDALSFVHGTAAGNIMTIECPKVQLTSPEDGEEDRIATEQFNLRLIPNAGNDEFKITYT